MFSALKEFFEIMIQYPNVHWHQVSDHGADEPNYAVIHSTFPSLTF